MAIITLSELISSLRGSIGQTTFSNNGAGLIAKRKVLGHKKITDKQQKAILKQSTLVKDWQLLTLTNKELWNDYATIHTRTSRYGLNKKLTGWNWFAAVNYMSILFSSILQPSPPIYKLPPSVPSYQVDLGDTFVSIRMSTLVDCDTQYLLIFSTAPSRTSALIPRSQYRLISTQSNDTFTFKKLTQQWDSVFGMNYRQLTPNAKFNIGFFIVPVDSSSYIQGVGTASLGTYNPVGIGFMVIGSTFIIA